MACYRQEPFCSCELTVIWKALPDSDYGEIVRLLILTGQRREEIGALRWSEIDLEARNIALPPARTKNSRPHDVPLSDQALLILKSRPAHAGRDQVFGDGPLPTATPPRRTTRPSSPTT